MSPQQAAGHPHGGTQHQHSRWKKLLLVHSPYKPPESPRQSFCPFPAAAGCRGPRKRQHGHPPHPNALSRPQGPVAAPHRSQGRGSGSTGAAPTAGTGQGNEGIREGDGSWGPACPSTLRCGSESENEVRGSHFASESGRKAHFPSHPLPSTVPAPRHFTQLQVWGQDEGVGGWRPSLESTEDMGSPHHRCQPREGAWMGRSPGDAVQGQTGLKGAS